MNNEDTSLPEGFAEVSASGSKYESRGLKKDSVESYRILPAMKTLLRARDVGEYWGTHFWLGVDRNNPTKKKFHPVLCTQEKDFRRGGIVVRECPLCTRIEKVKEKITSIETIGKQKGASISQIEKARAPHKAWLKDHTGGGKYHLYCIDRSETFVVLRLSPRTVKKVRAIIKTLAANKINPTGRKGVWLDFIRIGNGFEVPDDVQPHRIDQGGGASTLDFHVASNDLLGRALECLPNFDEERTRILYPEAVMQELADCTSDSPEEVNRILGLKPDERYSDGPEESSEEEIDFGAGASVAAAASSGSPDSALESLLPEEDEPATKPAPKTAPKVAAKATPKAKSEPKAADIVEGAAESFESLFGDL